MTGQNLVFLDQVREFVLFSLHAPSLRDWSLAVVSCGHSPGFVHVAKQPGASDCAQELKICYMARPMTAMTIEFL